MHVGLLPLVAAVWCCGRVQARCLIDEGRQVPLVVWMNVRRVQMRACAVLVSVQPLHGTAADRRLEQVACMRSMCSHSCAGGGGRAAQETQRCTCGVCCCNTVYARSKGKVSML